MLLVRKLQLQQMHTHMGPDLEHEQTKEITVTSGAAAYREPSPEGHQEPEKTNERRWRSTQRQRLPISPAAASDPNGVVIATSGPNGRTNKRPADSSTPAVRHSYSKSRGAAEAQDTSYLAGTARSNASNGFAPTRSAKAHASGIAFKLPIHPRNAPKRAAVQADPRPRPWACIRHLALTAKGEQQAGQRIHPSPTQHSRAVVRVDCPPPPGAWSALAHRALFSTNFPTHKKATGHDGRWLKSVNADAYQ